MMILERVGLSDKIRKWIHMCVCSMKYSILVNGEISGYFDGQKGLRQGDPVSPLLVTLIMDLLSSLLKEGWAKKLHNPHPRCKRIELSHISFVEGVTIFSEEMNCLLKPLWKSLNFI